MLQNVESITRELTLQKLVQMFTNLSQSPKTYQWDNMSLTFDLISDNSNHSENVNIVTFDSYDMQLSGKGDNYNDSSSTFYIDSYYVLYPNRDIQQSAYTICTGYDTTVFEPGNEYKSEIEIVAQWKNETLNKNESTILEFSCAGVCVLFCCFVFLVFFAFFALFFFECLLVYNVL